jgi:hypothetical protein
VLVVILDTAIDVLMHATGIYPPWFQPMRTLCGSLPSATG